MEKLKISELGMVLPEIPEDRQKTTTGGLDVGALLADIIANFSKYSGMQFQCDNGEVVSMTSTDGRIYYIGPEITISDFTPGSDSGNFWVDKSTGLSTEKFPLLINPPGAGVVANRIYNGNVGSYWAFNNSSYGLVGYFNGIPVRVESLVSDGAAFTLPNMGIYISPSAWNNMNEAERVQLLAHEYGHQYTYDTYEAMYGTGQAISFYTVLSASSVLSAILDWTGLGDHMHSPTEVWANKMGWIRMGQPPVWTGGGTVPYGYWNPDYWFPGMPGYPE